jgi:hypothetical protein
MNVGIGSVAALFLFWEYLLQFSELCLYSVEFEKKSETKEVPLMCQHFFL